MLERPTLALWATNPARPLNGIAAWTADHVTIADMAQPGPPDGA